MKQMLKAGVAAIILTVAGAGASHAATFANPFITASQAAGYPGYYNYNGTTDGWLSTLANGSATGYASQNSAGLWDNGSASAPGGGVAFLQNKGAQLSQTVTNFTSGHQYQIVVLANGRSVNGTNLPALSILVNGVEFGAANLTPPKISQVDTNGTYVTPFAAYTSATFTASSASELVAFVNNGSSGQADVTIDLAQATIRDVTAAPVNAVPEPASLVLLAVGLGGVAFARRRVLGSI